VFLENISFVPLGEQKEFNVEELFQYYKTKVFVVVVVVWCGGVCDELCILSQDRREERESVCMCVCEREREKLKRSLDVI